MAFTDIEVREAHQALLAEQPSGEDLCRLGLIYSTGDGAAADLVEAHKWFNLAAMMGSEAAKQYRGDLAREMSPAEIAAAQRAARQWMLEHRTPPTRH
jgi:TPR repeat protein